MSQHTPGPWIAGKVPRNPYPDPPGEIWSIQSAFGWWIADVYPFVRNCQDDSETEANAWLIAAAPDLLTVCQKAIQLAGICCDWHLEEVEIDGEMVSAYDLQREFQQAAAAATKGRRDNEQPP